MARITVVNDNPEFLELVRDILEDDRYEATTVDGDRPDALDRIRESNPDLLMIDLRMGTDGMHGWDVAQEVRRESEFTGLPILICSADIVALRELVTELSETNHVGTLEKPFSIDQLTDSIDNLLAATVQG